MTDLVAKWIDERYIKPNSIKNVRRGFRQFSNWVAKSPEEILETDLVDMRGQLIKFSRIMLERGYKPNTVLGAVNSVRAFFDFYGKSLGRIRNLPAMQKSIRDHVFSTQDLSKMWVVADVRYKALLALGCSLGWSINEILKLDRKFVGQKVKEAEEKGSDFIVFNDVRGKTGANSFGIINPFAVRCLKEYLRLPEKAAVRKVNGEWRRGIQVNTLFTLKEDAVNKALKKLARDAGITLTGRTRFHMIRGWLISMLTSLGLSEQMVKLIVGKRIPYTDETYLERLRHEIVERYPQIYPSLSLDPANHENGKFAKVKEELREKTEGFTEIIAEQQREIKDLRDQLKGLTQQVQTFMESFNVKGVRDEDEARKRGLTKVK